MNFNDGIGIKMTIYEFQWWYRNYDDGIWITMMVYEFQWWYMN